MAVDIDDVKGAIATVIEECGEKVADLLSEQMTEVLDGIMTAIDDAWDGDDYAGDLTDAEGNLSDTSITVEDALNAAYQAAWDACRKAAEDQVEAAKYE